MSEREQVEAAKKKVLEVYPKFQIRHWYKPNDSQYRAFDGKNSKSKPIGPWCKTRNKAIIAAASRLPAPVSQPVEQEKNEDNHDVRVVRHVDRSVLGPEETRLIPLPITDDRNQNPGYAAWEDLADSNPSWAATKFVRAKSALESLLSQPVAKEFSYFRCLSCGYSGTITEEEIAKHRERCAHGPTVAVDPSPQDEPVAAQEEPEPLCVICDSPACSLSANGKYYCSQDKPSWQEEEIEVSSEPEPSPQAEPSESALYASDRAAAEKIMRKRDIAYDTLPEMVKQLEPRTVEYYRAQMLDTLTYAASLRRELEELKASQPSTLPQSSPQAQGKRRVELEKSGLEKDKQDAEEWWAQVKPENRERAAKTAYATKLNFYRQLAAQSQPVAEIPQVVSDELVEHIADKGSYIPSALIARELQQYRQRFGKKEQ